MRKDSMYLFTSFFINFVKCLTYIDLKAGYHYNSRYSTDLMYKPCENLNCSVIIAKLVL